MLKCELKRITSATRLHNNKHKHLLVHNGFYVLILTMKEFGYSHTDSPYPFVFGLGRSAGSHESRELYEGAQDQAVMKPTHIG